MSEDNKDQELIINDISEVNADNVLDDDVFLWLFNGDDEVDRQRNLLKVEQIARDAKKLTEFKKLHAAYKKERNKFNAEQAQERGNEKKKGYQTHFEKSPYPTLYCGVWIADDKGIYTYSERGKTLACYHPITIVNFFQNAQTGEEKVRLAFKKNGAWKEITPAKDVIASSNKIVSLANAGIGVTSETSRALVRYLSDLEGINGDEIKVKTSTTKLGWMNRDGKSLFIPYDSEITFDGEEKFRNVYESIRPYGSQDAWIERVKAIRSTGRVEARIMLAASFASVLVHPCHALPFIVNLHGVSEGGKTVSLMLAASVWGNPDKDSGYMGDFLTTPVAIEARADLLNHLPLILDDTSKVSKRMNDDFSELVYTLCNGTGKDRSNQNLGLRRTNNWTNCVLTNGEHPMLSDNAQGGAINRVIDVVTDREKIFEDGHDIAEFLKSNFGHAGPLFVDAVKEMGIDEVRALQRTYEKVLIGKTDRLQKQCISMSLIIAADIIATQYIFKDDKALTIDEIEKYIKKESDISEDEKCLEYLYGRIVANINRFVVDNESDGYPETWGRIDENLNRVYIIKGIFDKLCYDEGYDPRSFLQWASIHHKIKRGNNSGYQRKIRIGRSKKAIWSIDLEWKDDLNDFDEI
jgi:uncharacterized protein (DUF927 family)